VTCFLLYFCARRLARDPDSIRLAFGGALAGFVWEALTAAREFFFSGAYRATAHLDQPNKLGHFLAGYLFLPFGFVLQGGRRYFLRAAAIVCIACLGLMASVSRGAVAAGLAMAIVAATRRRVVAIPILFVLFTYELWLPQKVLDRFQSSMVEEQGQMSFDVEHEGRVLIWKPVLRMALSNPMGVGLSQIRYRLPEYGYEGSKLRDAHNIYLQLAAEDGILACAVHVWLMLSICVIAYRLASRMRGTVEGAVGMGMFGTTVSFMISGFFGNFFYSNNLSGVFWILTGIVVNLTLGVRLTVSTPEAAPAPRSNSSAGVLS
jgi:O-antigen ligase